MKSYDNAVCFCDNHVLVANKPAGLLTQPDATHAHSLEKELKAWVKQTYEKEGAVFLHAVHRLDRPVGGLILFARTSKALSRLNEQARRQEIERIYVAEVEGVLVHKMGRLDHYLIHEEHRAVVAKNPEQEGAKHARLNYEALHYMPHATIVRIQLETGRYHQIRVQFAATGHPIVGDTKYGSKVTLSDGIIRLHCANLSFVHPVTKETLAFESVPSFDSL
ncbi:MAG: putative pseudouridine synthase yhcT [Chlamydiota bacterium]|jgi:23S rRNA pseudouridine1911/1915/1917 synthase